MRQMFIYMEIPRFARNDKNRARGLRQSVSACRLCDGLNADYDTTR